MKRLLLIACLACTCILSVNATVRRVGYFGPPVANVDYATFNAAYTAAVSGDTIYVFPGITNISQNFTKKLIVIGNGDLLDTTTTPKGNAIIQFNKGVATVSSMTFNAGSDGSVISGFYGGTYDIRTSNITITRNRECIVYLSTTNTNYSNPQIIGNYRVSIYNNNVNGSIVTNLLVANNLLTVFNTAPGNTYNGNITNNVWAYDNSISQANNGGNQTMSQNSNIDLGGGSYLFQNNIIVSSNTSSAATNYNYIQILNGSNSIFNYNMALETSVPINFGAGVGNVITPIGNASSIFMGFPAIGTNSADARYKLAAGSPAAALGAGGKPIGMYGGTTPYKLSIIPAIPTIYRLSSAQGNNPTGSTITISVSTRGNN